MAPKRPILVSQCEMNHQKLIILLILAHFLLEAVEAILWDQNKIWRIKVKFPNLMSTQMTSNQIWFTYFSLSGPNYKNHFALGHSVQQPLTAWIGPNLQQIPCRRAVSVTCLFIVNHIMFCCFDMNSILKTWPYFGWWITCTAFFLHCCTYFTKVTLVIAAYKCRAAWFYPIIYRVASCIVFALGSKSEMV